MDSRLPERDGREYAEWCRINELMKDRLEYCFLCGDPTGKAGPVDGSHYCNCGAGPCCDECWELHNCQEKEKDEIDDDPTRQEHSSD